MRIERVTTPAALLPAVPRASTVVFLVGSIIVHRSSFRARLLVRLPISGCAQCQRWKKCWAKVRRFGYSQHPQKLASRTLSAEYPAGVVPTRRVAGGYGGRWLWCWCSQRAVQLGTPCCWVRVGLWAGKVAFPTAAGGLQPLGLYPCLELPPCFP